jgi:hypothetical protein
MLLVINFNILILDISKNAKSILLVNTGITFTWFHLVLLPLFFFYKTWLDMGGSPKLKFDYLIMLDDIVYAYKLMIIG